MIPTLRIHLLGDFLLFADEVPVTSIDLPRLQSLLAYLLLHHNVPQARSHLAYLLWPDSTDAQAHTNLRNLVHKLRQALPDADAFLRSDRQTLAWQRVRRRLPGCWMYGISRRRWRRRTGPGMVVRLVTLWRRQ